MDDSYIFLFGSEGEVAAVKSFELVVRLEVWPPPDPAVDHVRQTLPVRHLKHHPQLVSSPRVTCSRPSKLLGMVTHLLGWPGQLRACSNVSKAPFK